MSAKIIFLVGVMIIVASTVGLGINLNSTALFNNIGSDNNVPVSVPDVDITNVVLVESAGDIDMATITLKNTDDVSHSYNVCVIIKADLSISDTTGTTSDCTATSSISASNTGSADITFTIPLDSSSVDYSDISIQEIT